MKKTMLIAGPCVIESESIMNIIAEELKEIESKYHVDTYFKASFDKANRTSINSYRGPGLYKGIEILYSIKQNYKLKIVTDIHEPFQASVVADIVDIIQIPAFLSRQTDLIIAAAKTGKPLNIKKGQFLSGRDMVNVVEKARCCGAATVYATERGNCFGYNDLVVDFRNIPIMKDFTDGVIMDCTHSVQTPGSLVNKSGGNPQYIENMAAAAKAFGADGYFFEIHPNPEKALCDGSCMLNLSKIRDLVSRLC